MNRHALTRVIPGGHTVVRGERGWWCEARPPCGFATTDLAEAMRHAVSQQYEARREPLPRWPLERLVVA